MTSITSPRAGILNIWTKLGQISNSIFKNSDSTMNVEFVVKFGL